MIRLETQVVVIGGGATGTAVLRDLAMRGIDAVLVERGNLAEGTSGNFHGLLHSGARYAVKDPPAAEECIHENTLLRRIAPQAIEDTGGFFVVLTDEDEAFLPRFLEGCRRVGIPTDVLSGAQALQEEPALSPQVRYAVTVPDGSIDGWTLCIGSVKAAKEYGAKVFLYTPVTKILREGDRVVGIEAVDRASGDEYEIRAEYVINATGPWTTKTARLAGLEVPMALDYGTMVVLNGRPVRRAINRCRPPTDGDIIVPVGTAIVLGTTSVPIQDPDDFCIQEWEIDLLLKEAVTMVPVVEEMGIQRYYAAVRPLYTPPAERTEERREVSRAFYVLDHEELDGLGGLITITGGKVTTCRLMAEKTVDLVCAKMGIQAPCRTHLEPLPPD
ncbi:FAD-dependent oxidoreductase [Thermogutta sp.]|uniref:FAD-dependent oxidoreductase n=1 Tax=Thermogutta sp. TaxID=1962930 RepID=UPI00321F891A